MTDSAVRAEFQDALDTIANAWSSGDLGRFMALHVDAPDIHYVGGGKLVEGHAAIAGMYGSRFGEGGGPGAMGILSLRLRSARRIDGEWGLVIAEFLLNRDGDASEHHGFTTMLLRRVNDAWRIVEDHSS